MVTESVTYHSNLLELNDATMDPRQIFVLIHMFISKTYLHILDSNTVSRAQSRHLTYHKRDTGFNVRSGLKMVTATLETTLYTTQALT